MHEDGKQLAGAQRFEAIKRIMSRPKAHYSMVIKNHINGARLKVELIDLPFSQGRQFRLRVNGQWARKVPVAKQDDRNQAD